MISDNAIALAHQFYDSMNQENLEQLLDCFTDEVNWYGLVFQEGIMAKRIQGKSDLRDFFAQSFRQLNRYLTPKDFIVHNSQILVTGHGKYEARETGFMFENDWIHILVFKGDKIDEVQTYIDALTLTALIS